MHHVYDHPIFHIVPNLIGHTSCLIHRPHLCSFPSVHQVHAGRDVLHSELVLPSGHAVSLSAMIHVMRRKKTLEAVIKVG